MPTHEDAGAQRRGHRLPTPRPASSGGGTSKGKKWVPCAIACLAEGPRRGRHRPAAQLPHRQARRILADRAGARRHRGRLHPRAVLDGRRHRHEEGSSPRVPDWVDSQEGAAAPKKAKKGNAQSLPKKDVKVKVKKVQSQKRKMIPPPVTAWDGQGPIGPRSTMVGCRRQIGQTGASVPLAVDCRCGRGPAPGQARPHPVNVHCQSRSSSRREPSTALSRVTRERSARRSGGHHPGPGYRAKRQKFTYGRDGKKQPSQNWSGLQGPAKKADPSRPLSSPAEPRPRVEGGAPTTTPSGSR